MEISNDLVAIKKTFLLSHHESKEVDQLKYTLNMPWLKNLASEAQPWRLVLTIEARRYDSQYRQTWSPLELKKAIQLLTKRINDKAWKHGARRRDETLGWAVSMHLGAYKDHPHFHVVISAPERYSDEVICEWVRDSLKRINWLKDQFYVESYAGPGIFAYLFHETTATLIPEACCKANP